MKPAHLGSSNPALDEIRRQLVDAGIGQRHLAGPAHAPPNSPVSSRQASENALETRFDADRTPRRPVSSGSLGGGSSLLALQLAELTPSTVPEAPPPPIMPSVLAAAPPRAATPAEVLARPIHAHKTDAEKMELFVQPSFRPVVRALAHDATYAALFTELAARPPANLASVLHQVCANEALREAAPRIAQKVAEGRAQDSNVPGELAAGAVAGYQVHPHTFAGPGADRDAIQARLTGQFTRDAAMVREAFVSARDSGQLATLYAAFTEKGSASCHAVRMNGVMDALATITERRAAAVANPFDGTRAFDSSAVLQAAYALGDGEAQIRAALVTRGVPAAGIDTIIAGLRNASLV